MLNKISIKTRHESVSEALTTLKQNDHQSYIIIKSWLEHKGAVYEYFIYTNNTFMDAERKERTQMKSINCREKNNTGVLLLSKIRRSTKEFDLQYRLCTFVFY